VFVNKIVPIYKYLQAIYEFKKESRVPGYRPRGPGSIPCATRFSEK
jgi:hypothetical protein